jgi:hypothetical protein
MALPSAATIEALERLCADPKNLVYIISGRDGDFLEQNLGHIKGLGMSAEHGGFMRPPGETKWTNFTEILDMSWLHEVEEIFKYYTEVSATFPICFDLVVDPPSFLSSYRGRPEATSSLRRVRSPGTTVLQIRNGVSSSAGSVKICSRTT